MSDTSKHNETANEEPVGEVDGRILKPIDRIAGFGVRPGLYRLNGATAFDNAVNWKYRDSGLFCYILPCFTPDGPRSNAPHSGS